MSEEQAFREAVNAEILKSPPALLGVEEFFEEPEVEIRQEDLLVRVTAEELRCLNLLVKRCSSRGVIRLPEHEVSFEERALIEEASVRPDVVWQEPCKGHDMDPLRKACRVCGRTKKQILMERKG